MYLTFKHITCNCSLHCSLEYLPEQITKFFTGGSTEAPHQIDTVTTEGIKWTFKTLSHLLLLFIRSLSGGVMTNNAFYLKSDDFSLENNAFYLKTDDLSLKSDTCYLKTDYKKPT
jgi:hypothetical protein